ncbi:MAG: ATP-binding protein [Actinomycetota bacterium]
MGSEAEAFVAYWLRVVRIGIVTTGLALGVLVLVPLISESPDIRTGPFVGILCVGAGVGLVVMVLPWRRLFESELGMLVLYAWSCVDIVLISLLIAASGGGRSELFFLYGLTTVFFAFYPRRAQPPLLSLTFASYLSALALTGWDVATAGAFVRLGLLAVLALMASFLSLELARRAKAAEEARSRSERWASLISAVAAAGRTMTLEPGRVLDLAVESAVHMGFDVASLCALDEEARTYHVVQARGLPEEHAAGVYRASEGITGLVLQKGETVVVEDYSALPEAIPSVRDAGFRAAIGSPIWVGGWLSAVLEAGNRREGTLTPQEVEAFEMLAAQTGLALETARRYDEERRTVERLEEMDRLKTDFLTTVSHELRTPLTVIQGAGITLEESWEAVDAHTRRRLLSGLNANARSLETLITSLLDFSRLEARNREAALRPIDVSQLLEGAAERLRALFDDRRLVVRIAPGLVAGGDASMIDRVVENLLSNAAKHTPEGTVVTLSAQREEEDILVAVSDDGPGIADEDLPYLGERFFRGGDVNARPKGLGLGLALVREILMLHGSELEIESRPGRGSRFSFRLAGRLSLEPPTSGNVVRTP